MKKIISFPIFVLISLLSSYYFCEAGETQWEDDVRLTNDTQRSFVSSANAWSVACDPQGRIHVVWYDERDGNKEIYYKRSPDGGSSWEPDQRLTVDNSWSWYPSVTTDSQGRIHIVWMDQRDGNWEIYYKRSPDGGNSWGADKRLTINSGISSYPSVAVDSQDRIHVVWNDSRSSNDEVYYKRSPDGGNSWGADTRLTASSGFSGFACVASDSQGRINVVWYDERDGNNEIYYKRSPDGGSSWESDKRLTTDNFNSWYPSVAVDSQDRIHIVWRDDRDGNDEIYYKRSPDGGDTWEPDTRLTMDGNYSEICSIAVDLWDRVHVVWDDYRDGNREIYYKLSTDGGYSWEPDTRLTMDGAFSWNPSVAIDPQNNIHVVWHDDRDGNLEVYHKRGIQHLVRKWTVMVYACADNDLDLNGVEDLNELEYAGSSEDIDMIFLLDRYGENDTKLYHVLNDPEGRANGEDMYTISEDISKDARSWLALEEDMGNPQTLKDFCLWTMQNYPAEHYFLSIWDHGNGIFLSQNEQGIFKGECFDEHGGVPGEYIDLAELKDVLAALYAENGNNKIDIVGHDTCLLGQIETHYQMKDYVDYGIASENYEPADGWDYGYPFKELVDNPDMLAQNLASQVVFYYGQRYGNQGPETLAALNLNNLENLLVPAVNNFAGHLYSFMNNFDSGIGTARANTEWYNRDMENPELYHFSELISQDLSLPLELRDSSSLMRSYYPQTVIASWHGNSSPNANGFTIWFPEDFTSNAHYNDYLTKIDFHQQMWDEFLGIYEAPLEVISVTLNPETNTIRRGETLNYSAEIINNSWVGHRLKAWTELTLSNGQPYPGNPYLGPVTVNLNPGQNLHYNLHLRIPLSAPLGTYTYTGKITTTEDFLLDEDYFEVTVIE